MIVNQKSVIKFKPSQWLGIFITYLSIPIILLVCGWDFSWWQAWVFFVLIVTAGLGGRIWAEHRHPGILAERFKCLKAQDVKSWDKIIAPLMALSLSFPLVIVAGLDHHFAWSPLFPIWMNLLGFVLTIFGYAFAIQATLGIFSHFQVLFLL